MTEVEGVKKKTIFERDPISYDRVLAGTSKLAVKRHVR
jgi:hypothetical protein